MLASPTYGALEVSCARSPTVRWRLQDNVDSKLLLNKPLVFFHPYIHTHFLFSFCSYSLCVPCSDLFLFMVARTGGAAIDLVSLQ